VENNYILRRLRYTFDINDKQMIKIWANADTEVTREQISAWLKKEDDTAYIACNDLNLAKFLNGFIIKHRGPSDGPQMKPESRLNNNIILRKLKIALTLRDDDVIEILALADKPIGKSELSAFFRKKGHPHYRDMQDQLLRRFMQGLQMKHRGDEEKLKDETPEEAEVQNKPERQHKEITQSTEQVDEEGINSDIWNKKK